jgi:hypothetical protein
VFPLLLFLLVVSGGGIVVDLNFVLVVRLILVVVCWYLFVRCNLFCYIVLNPFVNCLLLIAR